MPSAAAQRQASVFARALSLMISVMAAVMPAMLCAPKIASLRAPSRRDAHRAGGFDLGNIDLPSHRDDQHRTGCVAHYPRCDGTEQPSRDSVPPVTAHDDEIRLELGCQARDPDPRHVDAEV